MGRSAKVHKRVTKKTKGGASNKAAPAQDAHAHLQMSKKKATLKEKVKKAKSGGSADGSGVLGGADYVTLLMGGRRKAMEEAQKLPQSED